MDKYKDYSGKNRFEREKYQILSDNPFAGRISYDNRATETGQVVF